MKNKEALSIYTICSKETEGAIPLYNEIGKDEKICLYVIKSTYSGKPADTGKYILGQSDKSGGGDGFGAESDNMGIYKNMLKIEPENLILDTDGITVIGYVYCGEYDYYSNGDRNRYYRDIFLPLNGASRYTDYKYSYTVYPYDGTSSSSSSSKHTKFINR